MASTKHIFSRIPNGGFDRSFEPHVMGPDKWYDLLNFEPLVGKLQQTPPIVSKFALSLLTGEGATTPTRLIDVMRDANASIRYLILNETNARYVDPTNTATQTLLPCILQIYVPNNTTDTGQCLLYGFNSTDFSAAGDNIEVEIDAATTFKWRRNGGSYTTGVAIASVVSIGANGLKLAFMTTTGFTIGDKWKWQRYNTIPYDAAVTSTTNFPYDRALYQTDAYIGGVGRSILRVRDGFITSVGYKRAYGKYVGVYQNHLLIAHFAEGVYNVSTGVADSYDRATTPFVLAWSDLNNPDAMHSTVLNEADQYPMPFNQYPDGVNYGITGMGPVGKTWYVYLADAMSTVDYVGLPNVFQILPAFPVGSIFPSGLVVTKNGHYFIAKDNLYFFNGVQPQPIGDPVRKKLFSELLPPTDARYEWTYGYYDTTNRKVIWRYWTLVGGYYQCREVVYMERYNRWYFRNVPSVDSAAGMNLRCTSRTYQDAERLLYGATGYIVGDINAENVSNIIYDVAGAAPGYTNPMAESSDLFYEDLFLKKESDGIYLDAGWTSGVTGIKTEAQARNLISEAVSLVDTGIVWDGTNPGQRIGLPRAGSRVFRYRFTGTGSKPYGVSINGWGDIIYAHGAER